MSVAGVVIDEHDQVLITKRRDNGHWEAPGGILEPGETFEEGVAREVLEETGLQVEVERLTGAYLNRKRNIVALVYRCAPIGGAKRDETSETTNVTWVERARIDTLMSPAFGIRVHDAFGNSTASRSHDGSNIS